MRCDRKTLESMAVLLDCAGVDFLMFGVDAGDEIDHLSSDPSERKRSPTL